MPDWIQSILDEFTGGDEGRSVAFAYLDTPGQIISACGDVVRPAASALKIAAAAALVKHFPAQLNKRVPHSEIGGNNQPALCNFLRTDLTLLEIAQLSVATSDNMYASYIQSFIGFDCVNAFLAEAGCTRSVINSLYRDADLDGPVMNITTTAEDAIKLLVHLWENERYEPVLKAMNNNVFFSRIPAGLTDWKQAFHKTGTLSAPGVVNDIGIVKNGRPFAVAFLTEGQQDFKQTESDMAMAVQKLVL